ncbi:TIGR02117 family protein [Flavobacterium sp. RNTU_13]|uniref:TIGR02117 family protein n=1 Tax=Flavobacterium sp. RNTU_13 TaxID=3375145 RepID=UPI003985D358
MKLTLKKIAKVILKLILSIVGFVVLYLLSVFLLYRIPVNRHPKEGGTIPVYILTNGVHTDVVVPLKNNIKDWRKELKFSQTKANDSLAQYAAFGWGDKGFYLYTPEWSDLKASTAFKAAFYLSTSAIHTTFYRNMKEGTDCKKMLVTPDDYRALVRYIEDSFSPGADGNVQWIQGYSYGKHDAFYEAKGRYSLFYTCNTWANGALKAANQRAALWTPYDKGIFYHYE